MHPSAWGWHRFRRYRTAADPTADRPHESIYRNLKQLTEAGEITVVTLTGESPRYEPAQHEHHHFQCNVCKRVFDVHDCPGDLARLAPKGFTVEHHELTL